MMSRPRWRLLVPALFVLAAAAAFVYWRFVRPVEVPAVAVVSGSLPMRVLGPGTLQARVPVNLSARVTGTVTAVHADVGDRVSAGQLLATLDARELQSRRQAVAGQRQTQQRNIDAAEAALQRARADAALADQRRRRDEELQSRGFLSPAGLDSSRAAWQSAQAGVAAAEASLSARRAEWQASAHELDAAATSVTYTRLVAPFDAVVVQRLAEPGTTVAPGSTILRLVDPSTLWVAARVDEAVLARVKAGQAATIRLRSGESLAGRVARIARVADTATREVEVHVAFEQPPAAFVIDQEAQVAIDTGVAEGLLVPAGALTRDRDGRSGVLALRDGRARFVAANPGASDGERVVVSGELTAGEPVADPAAGLRAGQAVRPVLR